MSIKKCIGILVLAGLAWQVQGQQFYYADSLSRFNDSKVTEIGIFDVTIQHD